MTEYNEINLIDYIKVVFKNKRVILIFLLIGVVLAWAITLSLPKNYRAETYLEIGNYGTRQIINYNDLVAKINTGLYGSCPGLSAEVVKDTTLIRITVTTNNTKEAEDSLASLNELILEKHSQRLSEKKESLDQAISNLEDKVKSLTWQGQEIGALELEIYRIKNQIEDLQPTEVLRKPTIIFSREPNLILNLIFGTILGAFVGIFSVLAKEWWDKNREKLKY